MYYHFIATAEVLGNNNVNELTVNRSSIRHTAIKYRKERAERICRYYNWVKEESVFIYWHRKLLQI